VPSRHAVLEPVSQGSGSSYRVPVLDEPSTIHAELAAAAISENEAVISYNGNYITAPFEQIDPEKVELSCDDVACVLIPDDGNPLNDINQDPHVSHNLFLDGEPMPSIDEYELEDVHAYDE